MTFNTTTYASEHVEAHRLRGSRRRFFYFVAAALALIVAVACGTPAPDSASTPVEPTTIGAPAAPDAPQKKAAAPAGVGDGQHALGDDIKAGTYTTTVPADAFGCYWARLRNFDGDLRSIIANDNLMPGAKGRVAVKKSDAGVEFSGGCTWKRVSK